MKIKVRNPAPVSAGKMDLFKDTKYYVNVSGIKHFYPDARQLIQAALAGVA
jgi:hypothetical protein